MFTGRLPGAVSARWRRPLDREAPVVAEAFREAGYATGAFVANPFYTHHETGLDRGFDVYRDFDVSLSQVFASTTFGATASGKLLWSEKWPGAVKQAVKKFDLTVSPEPPFDRRHASDVVREVGRWQRSLDGRPFFAFLNLFDAHDPYDPPVPWGEKFAEARPVIRRYEGGVAYMDHVLDSLFSDLRRRGLLDRTVVVVTSDHGEQFGEHGLRNHGNSLYLPLLHVPLVVRYPARLQPGRVPDAVSLRDLAATLLDLAGVTPRRPPGGQSLVPIAVRRATARDVLAETEQLESSTRHEPAARGDMAALLTDSLHFIRNEDGSFELYAYRVDPEEAHDLVTTPEGCARAVALDARVRVAGAMLASVRPIDPRRCTAPDSAATASAAVHP
jgi:arylsulfatase A-like enzyme